MEDAEKRERPADVNRMCEKCITDCPGTTCKVWTVLQHTATHCTGELSEAGGEQGA